MSDLTRAEAIIELTEHLNHWKRLLKEGICGKECGERTIKSLELAIDSLKTDLTIKEAYDKGYKDKQEALAFHLELCKEEQEPCEDAISRKDAINAIKRTVATEQIKELKRLPSIQPKPKTGHWIEDDMTYCGVELVNYKCDKCGEMGGAWRKELKPDELPKYCMNCGAKMLPTDS